MVDRLNVYMRIVIATLPHMSNGVHPVRSKVPKAPFQHLFIHLLIVAAVVTAKDFEALISSDDNAFRAQLKGTAIAQARRPYGVMIPERRKVIQRVIELRKKNEVKCPHMDGIGNIKQALGLEMLKDPLILIRRQPLQIYPQPLNALIVCRTTLYERRPTLAWIEQSLA
ncbi:unnamed protein product [Tilletia controversa]|nr:unnamed protein product [Tilletia controversa]